MVEQREKKRKGPVTGDTTSRRSFLQNLWICVGGLAVFEAILIGIDFLRPRRSRSEMSAAAIVVAGPVSTFEPNTVTAFPQGRFYLARLAGGGFLALSRECTHLGCTVPWDRDVGRFVCPCHASAFDITGDVLNSPAPRALDLHPVRVENGIVKVDTATRLKRASFDPRQVRYA